MAIRINDFKERDYICSLQKSLNSDNVLAILCVCFAIPDIFSKRSNFYDVSKSRKNNYINWFNKYVKKYYEFPVAGGFDNVLTLNGELFYKLRCSFLHSGNTVLELKNYDDKNQFPNCVEFLINDIFKKIKYNMTDVFEYNGKTFTKIVIDVNDLGEKMMYALEDFISDC